MLMTNIGRSRDDVGDGKFVRMCDETVRRVSDGRRTAARQACFPDAFYIGQTTLASGWKPSQWPLRMDREM